MAQKSDTVLTLQDVIKVAKAQSIDALVAKQTFEQSYWAFKNFKAEKLPSVDLKIDAINYNRSATNRNYDYVTQSYQYFTTNTNTSDARLSLDQSIPFTGGLISVSSDLVRNDDFNKGTWDYASNPSIRLNQPLFSYNKYKWSNKIEPKKYEIAKAEFNQNQEEIAIKAINLFFDLASTQVELAVAKQNLSNADTLYKISKGRYEMGKISQNDLLQMELNLLNSKTSLNEAKIKSYDARNKLTSYLRIKYDSVMLIIPDTVPDLEVDVSKALLEAKQNNPVILQQENEVLMAKQEVAQKKAEKGLNASLEMAWGYSRIDTKFPDIITNRNNLGGYQNVSLGLDIPLVDWKVSQRYYRIALLDEKVANLKSEQAIIDFEQNIILQVKNFNQQSDQFEIAKKSEFVADNRYKIAKQRFLIGKVSVLDLNVSQKDRDAEKLDYINALRSYWTSFYSLRKSTLFDFMKDRKIDYTDTYTIKPQ